MRTRALTLFLVFALAGTLSAEDLTPRQTLEQAEKQFAEGRGFSADEALSLAELEGRLAASGDGDLAADLNLLRLASAAQALAVEARAQAEATRDEEQAAWNVRQRNEHNRGLWKTVRDGGLAAFTLSTLTLVSLAAVVEIDDNRQKSGAYSDWQDRQYFVDRARWGVAWAAGASLLSLFPLLWGEAKQ